MMVFGTACGGTESHLVHSYCVCLADGSTCDGVGQNVDEEFVE